MPPTAQFKTIARRVLAPVFAAQDIERMHGSPQVTQARAVAIVAAEIEREAGAIAAAVGKVSRNQPNTKTP